VFGSGRVLSVAHYPENSPGRAGTVMTVQFEVAGVQLVGINGGPEFTFTEAVSLQVNCEDQAEVDRYWDRLVGDGGEESQCGWLKDRYGLSWQIVPSGMEELFADPDPGRAQRAMQAVLQMTKLDVAAMRAAADGVPVA
jgi:predicted 3-demethylubiquinone-9 3-methyltransferase (glyoxalase superfamily)